MVSRSDVARLERAQGRILSAASSDLRLTVAQLDFSQPTRARDGLLEVYPALASRYGDASATVAAEWYEGVRRRNVGGTYSATLAASVAAGRLEQTVRWAAGSLFDSEPGSVLALLDGSMARLLGDSSRDTITGNVNGDRRAVGWHRIARPTGCEFCVMLSQRGAVYRKETANFASHDNCHCRAAPSWDPSAPEVEAMAYVASQRTSGMTPEQKARHNRRVRYWMEDNRDQLDTFRAEL